jgi:hypothetical protein
VCSCWLAYWQVDDIDNTNVQLVQCSRVCTPADLSTGIINLLQPAQAEVVWPAVYVFSLLGYTCSFDVLYMPSPAITVHTVYALKLMPFVLLAPLLRSTYLLYLLILPAVYMHVHYIQYGHIPYCTVDTSAPPPDTYFVVVWPVASLLCTRANTSLSRTVLLISHIR